MNAFTLDYERNTDRLLVPCGITASGMGLVHSHKFGSSLSLWDTGCPVSTISQRMAVKLHLPVIDSGIVATISGNSTVPYYEVDVLLPGGMAIGHLKVMAGDLNGFDLLVGMDIIRMGSFAVSNLHGNTVMTFQVPSDKVLNFVSQD